MTDNQPPYGQPSSPYEAPVYQAPTYPSVGQRAGGGGSGSGRPGTVTTAAVLTHIGAAFLIAIAALLLVGLLISVVSVDNLRTDAFSGMTVPEVRLLLGGLGGGFLVFGVVLIVLAVQAARGHGWARVTLTVLGGLSIVMFALSVVSSPWVIPGLLYQLVAIGLLWLGGANGWFRTRKAARRSARSAPPVPPGPQAPPIG